MGAKIEVLTPTSSAVDLKSFPILIVNPLYRDLFVKTGT
jgi:hypothetical protein